MRHCANKNCGATWTGKAESCPNCEMPWAGEGEEPKRCIACGEGMALRGVVPLRTHGPEEGPFHLLRGMQEWDERLWKVTVYRCKACRRLEFYEP